MKILLVEDSRTRRQGNEREPLKAGYEVVSAEDGESALQAISKNLPDLILLDLMLPRINGLEILTRLKPGNSTAKIPVIVISGLSERNRQKLIDAGAEDYIEKSTIINDKGANLLPEVLSELISRMNRKRSGPFSMGLVQKTGFVSAQFSPHALGLRLLVTKS